MAPLVMAVLAQMISQGAQKAMQGSQESSATGPGNIPEMNPPQDPFEMFKSLMSKTKGGSGGGL